MADQSASSLNATKDKVLQWTGSEMQFINGTATFYEKDTWTPTLVGSSTAGDYSISGTHNYIKIGKLVYVQAIMSITVNSAGTGNAQFGGLPYNKEANSEVIGSARTDGIDLIAGAVHVITGRQTTSADKKFILQQIQDDASPMALDVTSISTGDTVRISVMYIAE